MGLAHNHAQLCLPLLIADAELGVTVWLTCDRPTVLFPQQLPRNTFSFQLLMDMGKIRLDPNQVILIEPGSLR